MPVLSKPTIAGASFVLEFLRPVEQMRFEQRRAEEAFGSFIKAQSRQTNIPDSADPSMPRIVFTTEKKTISLSKNRCQLDLKFPNTELGFWKQLDAIERNIHEFYSLVTTKFALSELGLVGLVANIQFASENSNIDLQKLIFEKFYKINGNLPIASTQVMIGFEFEKYFVNFTANVYESRRLELSQQGIIPGKQIRFEDMPLLGRGLGFTVDINNRIEAASPGFILNEDPSEIFSSLKRFLNNNFLEISGLELQ